MLNRSLREIILDSINSTKENIGVCDCSFVLEVPESKEQLYFDLKEVETLNKTIQHYVRSTLEPSNGVYLIKAAFIGNRNIIHIKKLAGQTDQSRKIIFLHTLHGEKQWNWVK